MNNSLFTIKMSTMFVLSKNSVQYCQVKIEWFLKYSHSLFTNKMSTIFCVQQLYSVKNEYSTVK